MCYFPNLKSNRSYDPAQAEANPTLGLTKDEVAGYSNYRNTEAAKGLGSGHIQTIEEWAKANRRGTYANPDSPPPALPDPYALKPGETYKTPKTGLGTSTSGGLESGPPATPSLTDPQLDAIRESQLLMLKSGRGRASTFLTGPTGLTDAPQLGSTVLGSLGPKLALKPGGFTAAGKPGRTLLGR
jgi:hypothetical protein